MAAPLRSVVINPVKTHTATVLFLHGLGDSGYGWKSVGEMLAPLLPNVKWVFPHAPSIKVTLNFGQTMPAWYDIYSLDKSIKKQDEAGILQSVTSSYFCFDIVEQLIANEINSGIQSERIIVGGFSQGAAISLLTGLLSQFKLGGIICLSGYLPISEKVDAVMLCLT
jgi:predicted esterase